MYASLIYICPFSEEIRTLMCICLTLFTVWNAANMFKQSWLGRSRLRFENRVNYVFKQTTLCNYILPFWERSAGGAVLKLNTDSWWNHDEMFCLHDMISEDTLKTGVWIVWGVFLLKYERKCHSWFSPFHSSSIVQLFHWEQNTV